MIHKNIFNIIGDKSFKEFNYNDWILYISAHKEEERITPLLIDDGCLCVVIPKKYQTNELILALKLS